MKSFIFLAVFLVVIPCTFFHGNHSVKLTVAPSAGAFCFHSDSPFKAQKRLTLEKKLTVKGAAAAAAAHFACTRAQSQSSLLL